MAIDISNFAKANDQLPVAVTFGSGAKTRVSQRVRNMIGAAASTPTLTIDGALASAVRIAATASAPNQAYFRYEGFGPTSFGGDGRGVAALVGGPAGGAQVTWRVAFDFDGQKFRVAYLSLGGQIRVWANEQPSAWTTIANDSAAHTLLVDYGSRAYRRIVVELDNAASVFGVWFAGIDHLATDTVWLPGIPTGLGLAIVGDSYTASIGATFPSTGFPQTVARALGIQNSFPLGVGGAGWVSVGGTGAGNYANVARTADVIACAPDIVLVQGSINDTGNNGTIGPQVAAFVQAIKAGLPNAIIILTGVLRPQNPTANDVLVNTDIKNAAAAAGVAFIDAQAAPAWFNGMGTSGVPTGDGNADFYMGVGGAAQHPTQAGNDALGFRLAREVGKIIGIST